MERLSTVSKNKTRNLDHEELITKLGLNLKNLVKPLGYSGIDHILYDYTVEVTNSRD